MPRVSAFSLLKELDEVVFTYVEFMERAGFHELVMLFDGPMSPGVRDFFEVRRHGPTQIVTQELDESFFRDALGTGYDFSRKYAYAIMHAHALCTGDWLWVADPDEFPEDPQAMFAALDRAPPETEALIVPPAEAVWGPDEGEATPFTTCTFRLAKPRGHLGWRLLRRIIYGRWHIFFDRNIVSHTAGKYFVRKTAVFDRLGAHRPYRDQTPIGSPLADLLEDGRVLHVRHYDAISYERWLAKMRLKASLIIDTENKRSRRAHFKLVRDLVARMENAPDETTARRIGERAFLKLYHVGRFQMLLLRLIGGVTRLDPALEPNARGHGGARDACA